MKKGILKLITKTLVALSALAMVSACGDGEHNIGPKVPSQVVGSDILRIDRVADPNFHQASLLCPL